MWRYLLLVALFVACLALLGCGGSDGGLGFGGIDTRGDLPLDTGYAVPPPVPVTPPDGPPYPPIY